jgi:hypothetical protein
VALTRFSIQSLFRFFVQNFTLYTNKSLAILFLPKVTSAKRNSTEPTLVLRAQPIYPAKRADLVLELRGTQAWIVVPVWG